MASKRTTLADSNVLLDVFSNDPDWSDWSSATLAAALQDGPVVINPLIYAELSIRFPSQDLLDSAIDALGIQRADLPYDAAFVAGDAFVTYRRNGGTRRSPLPDFYIGAHALVQGYALLTRDRQRYTTYFPKLELITPP